MKFILLLFLSLPRSLAFVSPNRVTPTTRLHQTVKDDDAMVSHDGPQAAASNRRVWLQQQTLAITTALTTVFATSAQATAETPAKVLVLGGTGFVGQRIVKLLRDEMGIQVIATSTNGRDGTEAFDITSSNADAVVERLAKGCTAVISTIGAIGTELDQPVNAGSGEAARGAKRANVERFVYISVAPEVVSMAKDIDFLKPYMTGKLQSETIIRSEFPNASTLIEPTFIYGGDDFKVNPPRVAQFYGSFIESVLSSSPLRALTNVAPEGIIKIALEPPVSVDTVAQAAVAAALGKTRVSTLDTYDTIRAAAATL